MTPVNYELHPLCTLFPRMGGYEFDCLKLDVKEHGQREPIITHEVLILDGGNRYRACLDLGIEPQFMKFGGDNPVAYVLSANLHRRHLTPPQQAAIVASAQDWAKAQEHGGDRTSAPESTRHDTTKTRAALSGASVSTQRRADAVAKASPELAKQVAQGEVTLQKAVEKVAPSLASKPKKSAPPPETPAYDPAEDAAKEQAHLIESLIEENQTLKDAIAVGNLPEPEQTVGEIIVGLRAHAKTLEATVAAITVSRDTLQRENAQLKTQCKIQASKLKKFEGGK